MKSTRTGTYIDKDKNLHAVVVIGPYFVVGYPPVDPDADPDEPAATPVKQRNYKPGKVFAFVMNEHGHNGTKVLNVKQITFDDVGGGEAPAKAAPVAAPTPVPAPKVAPTSPHLVAPGDDNEAEAIAYLEKRLAALRGDPVVGDESDDEATTTIDATS